MSDGFLQVSKSADKSIRGYQPIDAINWATHEASSVYHDAIQLAHDHTASAITAAASASLLLTGKGGLAKRGMMLLSEIDGAAKSEHVLSAIEHTSKVDLLPSLKIEGENVLARNSALESIRFNAQASEVKPKLVHVSNTPDLTILRDIDPGSDIKPHGLWYSPDHAWAKSDTFSSLEKEEGYSYLVDTSKANILKVSTLEEIEALHQQYGIKSDREFAMNPNGGFNENSRINWRKVKEDYDGIQFDNFENDHALPDWYRSLDVDSGSIWNASKVKLTPLGKMPSVKFEEHLVNDFDNESEGVNSLIMRDDFGANYLKLLDEQLRLAK